MNNNPKGAKNPKKPLIFYYAVMLLVLMMLNWLLFPSLLQRQVTEVGYDEFISMVDKGQVETIAYDKQNQEITFEAKNDKGKDALYKTGIFPDDELAGRLLDSGVKFTAEIPTQTSPLLSMLISYVVPIVLIIAVGQWLQKKMMKNMGGNMMSFGKSNAKIYAETETGKTFADVAGADEEKEELSEIVEELYVDDAVDLVEELPATVVRRVLQNTKPETRKLINQFLNYPENTAGSIMTAEYVGLKKTMTVEQCFAYIRHHAVDSETIYTCYVMDEKRMLDGVVTVKDLLLQPYERQVGDIMDTHVIKARTTDDQELVADTMNKYGLLSMPVVDREDRLVGIITVDDVMEVMEEEATEDIEKMAGMAPSERPYLYTSVLETWKARIPWLLILMLSATFTGLIINHFQIQLAACLVLSSFIPMLSGTGGNSGTQASVAVIRGLALGEIEFSDLPRVVWKEIRTAVLCGISLAAACFAKIMLVDRLMLGNEDVTCLVALVVCATMALTVLVAKVIGCVLPMLAKKVGFDPAVMASPFITTIVDALSLLIYFGIASVLLLN